MITSEQCQAHARDLRIAAFRVLADEQRRLRGLRLGFDPHSWMTSAARRQANDLFGRADQYIALSEAPFWKRWFK